VEERENIVGKQNLVRVLAQLLVNLKKVKENKQEAINILNSASKWPVNSEINTAFGFLLYSTRTNSGKPNLQEFNELFFCFFFYFMRLTLNRGDFK